MTSALRLIMWSSKTGRKTLFVASAVWHVAFSCWNQMLPISSLFTFCEQKFVQHGPIAIAIDGNGLSLLIYEEKWPNYASGIKSGPNSDSFWVRPLFNVCVRQFCLLTYPPRSKWASSEKIISFAKIVIFCKSIANPLSKTKTHCMFNWLQLLNQLNFVWRHTVFMQNSSQWCLPNV